MLRLPSVLSRRTHPSFPQSLLISLLPTFDCALLVFHNTLKFATTAVVSVVNPYWSLCHRRLLKLLITGLLQCFFLPIRPIQPIIVISIVVVHKKSSSVIDIIIATIIPKASVSAQLILLITRETRRYQIAVSDSSHCSNTIHHCDTVERNTIWKDVQSNVIIRET